MNGYYANANYENHLIPKIKAMPAECLMSLFNIVQDFCKSMALKPAESSFKQGWEEAMRGETMPIEELWTDIEDGG